MSASIVKGRHAIEAVARALRKLGFYKTRQTATQSVYLRCPDNQFTLRISDHRLKRTSRARHNHIVFSQTIPREIVLTDTFMIAFDIAIRFYAMSRVRLGLVRSA